MTRRAAGFAWRHPWGVTRVIFAGIALVFIAARALPWYLTVGGLMLAIVGGPDAGHVGWHPSVVEQARATGLEVDDAGKLREVAT